MKTSGYVGKGAGNLFVTWRQRRIGVIAVALILGTLCMGNGIAADSFQDRILTAGYSRIAYDEANSIYNLRLKSVSERMSRCRFSICVSPFAFY